MTQRQLVMAVALLIACGDDVVREQAAVCGDGLVQEGELCDDGNEVDTDGCLSGCVPARCGDGVVRTDLGGA